TDFNAMTPLRGALFDEHVLECALPKFFVGPFVARPLSGFWFDVLDVLIPRGGVGVHHALLRIGLCCGLAPAAVGKSDPTSQRFKRESSSHGDARFHAARAITFQLAPSPIIRSSAPASFGSGVSLRSS